MTPTQELRLTSALVSLFEVTKELLKEATQKTGLGRTDTYIVLDIVAADVMTTTFKALPELRGSASKVDRLTREIAYLASLKALAQTDDEPDGSLEIPGA